MFLELILSLNLFRLPPRFWSHLWLYPFCYFIINAYLYRKTALSNLKNVLRNKISFVCAMCCAFRFRLRVCQALSTLSDVKTNTLSMIFDKIYRQLVEYHQDQWVLRWFFLIFFIISREWPIYKRTYPDEHASYPKHLIRLNSYAR